MIILTRPPMPKPGVACVVQAIGAYWTQHGYGPSYRDLMRACALGSTSTAQRAVETARTLGLVEPVDLSVGGALTMTGQNPARSIRLTDAGRQVAAWKEAGA